MFVSVRWVPLLAAVSVAWGGAGCRSIKEGYDTQFKASFTASFAKSCVEAAVKKGASEAQATPVCTCLGTSLVEHNSAVELTMMAASIESPKSKAMIQAATDECTAGRK